MPRVNRDLQRRLAARRERERRRPAERRYRFAAPEPAELEPDETLVEQDGEASGAAEAPLSTAARGVRQPREAAPPAKATGGRKPFSAYKDEYAYVYGDLRRVAAVIGGLLAVLIVLYFVLPALVH
jgi:hypothetical protein